MLAKALWQVYSLKGLKGEKKYIKQGFIKVSLYIMAKLRRFLVEVFAFVLCIFVGAAVFHVIEYKDNDTGGHSGPNSSEVLDCVVRNISLKYNISARDMNHTVKQLLKRLANGEDEKWDVWDFTGCYFFAGTVAFTIGK